MQHTKHTQKQTHFIPKNMAPSYLRVSSLSIRPINNKVVNVDLLLPDYCWPSGGAGPRYVGAVKRWSYSHCHYRHSNSPYNQKRKIYCICVTAVPRLLALRHLQWIHSDEPKFKHRSKYSKNKKPQIVLVNNIWGKLIIVTKWLTSTWVVKLYAVPMGYLTTVH